MWGVGKGWPGREGKGKESNILFRCEQHQAAVGEKSKLSAVLRVACKRRNVECIEVVH